MLLLSLPEVMKTGLANIFVSILVCLFLTQRVSEKVDVLKRFGLIRNALIDATTSKLL